MTSIKTNEEIGRAVEKLVNKRVKGTLVNKRIPYDIETDKELIEVKSARLKTKGSKRGGRKEQYMQTGRFNVLLTSHNKLVEIAKEKLKVPLYIFCLYDLDKNNKPKIINIRTLVWVEVNGILEGRVVYRRKDGLKSVIFPHTLIPWLEESL